MLGPSPFSDNQPDMFTGNGWYITGQRDDPFHLNEEELPSCPGWGQVPAVSANDSALKTFDEPVTPGQKQLKIWLRCGMSTGDGMRLTSLPGECPRYYPGRHGVLKGQFLCFDIKLRQHRYLV
jgi:hypothetical protein